MRFDTWCRTYTATALHGHAPTTRAQRIMSRHTTRGLAPAKNARQRRSLVTAPAKDRLSTGHKSKGSPSAVSPTCIAPHENPTTPLQGRSRPPCLPLHNALLFGVAVGSQTFEWHLPTRSMNLQWTTATAATVVWLRNFRHTAPRGHSRSGSMECGGSTAIYP